MLIMLCIIALCKREVCLMQDCTEGCIWLRLKPCSRLCQTPQVVFGRMPCMVGRLGHQ